MNHKRIAAILVALLVAFVLTTQASFGDVWKDLAGYKYGDGPNPCEQVEKLLQETPVSAYGEIERELIAVVASQRATQTGKAYACRFLQQIGTERCIPVVSGLLSDEILSHHARLVLEQLKSVKADKAMYDALATAPEAAKIGILGSLGVRRYAPSVGAAAQLISNANPAVAEAAIQAMGRIGGTESARHLSSMKPNRKLVRAQMQALVNCAGSLSGGDAAVLYEKVIAGNDVPCRIAALRGLVCADAASAASYITGAIKGTDVQLRRGGISVVAETTGEKFTLEMLDLMDELAGTRKAELIAALGSRGDKAALKRIMANISSNNIVVRDATIEAVSKLGDASVVKLLLSAANTPVIEESVAKAIAGMKDKRINAVLVESLKDRKLRHAAIKASVARGCTEATGELLKLAAEGNADIRKEVWAGLGALAGPNDMESVMAIVINFKAGQNLSYVNRAIRKILAHAENRSQCFETIAGYYARATEATKGLILDLGAESGSAEALKLEQAALASGNKELYGRALRALANWPNELVAADLYKQANNASKEVDRIIALRGYIRVAGLESAELSAEDRMAMLRKAMILASRGEEKKRIVSCLQNVNNIESLDTLKKYMADPALRLEAQMSAANLIWNLCVYYPAEVAAMAEQLVKSDNKTVAAKAQKTLRELELEKKKTYILAWMIAGPYSEHGKRGEEVFKAVYPPEQGKTTVKWKVFIKGIEQEVINLEDAVGKLECTCVYVKTTLVSLSDQTVRLEMGSDDGIKAWLNGTLVHSNWAARACKPGQDVKTVKLKKGPNVILLKIVNGGGNWAFSCRLRQENGSAVKGLIVRP